jgi:7-cyano-7-deazaguanine synthase
MKKAVVLSSGGVDSTTCLSIAIDELGAENVSTVSIFYGQKHNKELEQAEKIAEYYGVTNYQIDLSEVMRYNKNCTLLSNNHQEIDHSSYAEQIEKSKDGIINTYVPFRNGLMLSSAASLALSIYPDDEIDIYLGTNADDVAVATYADCSEEFTNAIGQAINIGTYGKVSLRTPLVNLSKAEVVREGLELGTPYELTWSCYEDGETPCGTCATCIYRAIAFKLNDISDPAL